MTLEHEPQQQGWVFAKRFDSIQEARLAYEAAVGLMESTEAEFSTFRFLLNDISHVALIGELPLPSDVTEFVEDIFKEGSSVEIPENVITNLKKRREHFKKLDIQFLEIHRDNPLTL